MIRTMRSMIPLLLALLTFGACANPNRIVVGSKNFTEQVILGELVAQHLETWTGLEVDRRLNLGGTFICHEGLISGQLDIYVEYTGTALAAILEAAPGDDAAGVLSEVRAVYAERFGVDWAEPLGFSNTFAMIVRGEDARRLGLQTISDAVAFAPEWTPGFGYEFAEREDGYRGLRAAYDLEFSRPPREMELGLIYQALAAGEVDLVAGNSTDGLIAALDLAILADDRQYFPPYEAVPLVRHEVLELHPEVGTALDALGGVISEEDMRQMNYRVDGNREAVQVVVAEFLASKGL